MSSSLRPEDVAHHKTRRQNICRRKKKSSKDEEEEEEEPRESQRIKECLGASVVGQNQILLSPALVQSGSGFSEFSDLVVDVGRTLRRHFLYDVDRVAVIAADLLVVRAEDTVSSP